MNPKGSPKTIEEQHSQALKDLRNARRFAVLAPVTLLVLMLIGVWLKFDGFIKTDGHKVPAAILKGAPKALSPVGGLTVEAIERVAPIYQAAIARVYERDKAIYAKLFASQIQEFIAYSQSLGSTVKNNFEGLSDTVMAALEERLTPGMSVEERIEFRGHAALHLYTLLNEEIENNWQHHVDQVNLTCKQLYSISLTAPDKPLPPRYLIGGALELLGIYLQEKPLN